MMPKPSAKYMGCGPLTLAKLTVQFEGDDDIEFLAIQDAVNALEPVERRMYREAYYAAMRAYVQQS
jgi:hypothetical protein